MKVLITTDGSECAENAARLLVRLPHSQPLHVTILTVMGTPYVRRPHSDMEWIQEAEALEKKRMQTACEKIAQLFEGADATLETVYCEGHTGRKIIQEAKERDIDLIVLGAQGHSLLSRVILGSVSDFVATNASCSVLVVRPSSEASAAPRTLKLCLAYDGSDGAQHAIEQLDKFKWGAQTQLQVVEVLLNSAVYTDMPVELDLEPIRKSIQQSISEVGQSLTRLTPNVTSHVVESQSIGDAIVGFAEENKSDVVILGSTGMGLMGRFLMGSVANYVLRHSPSSVWIARKSKVQEKL